MSTEELLAKSAIRLRELGLYAALHSNCLTVAHYFRKPNAIPKLTGPTSDFDQPYWKVTYHGRLVGVYGFPLDEACGTDEHSGATGEPNRPFAKDHCEDGYIFLGDENRIRLNVGRWILHDAPKWRFENTIQNIVGGVDPDGVIRVTDDLSKAIDWLFTYNEITVDRIQCATDDRSSK
ncbi:hypothetical protein Mal15_12230 [Stieleria maiorica]|uniref:Uncharacterized protein n=1 Tax=Stieleria maiorica TaxID=2795974 RepID=A0A5B9MC96_9BACT|nr:hypothetical protein [Stieleria maiorica]QEF97185.1 hypothetical protein Mal15_12230 [Stieleria maiorica]